MSARNIREARPPLSRGPPSFQLNLATLSLANMAAASPDRAGRPDQGSARALRSALSSPEPEAQRGRKRLRSPLPFALVTTQTPSGESSTLRGRRRYRSTSLINFSAFSSRSASRNFRDASYSPSRRQVLRIVKIDRRRSQSPSRSRSPFAKHEPSKRRRHRTRSRSRSHNATSSATLDLKSPLQFEVVPDEKEAPEPDKG